MAKGTIHIGTSGWSYKHWKGVFYPDKLPAAQYLKFYAQHYNTVELNNSFYKLPSVKTVKGWAAQLPADFKICPKLNRYLSHFKKLHDPESALENFFNVFEHTADCLGPVLIQLPANFSFNLPVAAHFYEVLKSKYGTYRFAMEVRHPAWFTQESILLMKQNHITLVMAQSGKFIYDETITAKDIYLRLHGPGKLYHSSYNDDELRDFARKIRKWQLDHHNVWVFFNNDLNGYAVKNANTLKCLLGKEINHL
jgi:uncharacterized protein YecE (DUF72 family)